MMQACQTVKTSWNHEDLDVLQRQRQEIITIARETNLHRRELTLLVVSSNADALWRTRSAPHAVASIRAAGRNLERLKPTQTSAKRRMVT